MISSENVFFLDYDSFVTFLELAGYENLLQSKKIDGKRFISKSRFCEYLKEKADITLSSSYFAMHPMVNPRNGEEKNSFQPLGIVIDDVYYWKVDEIIVSKLKSVFVDDTVKEYLWNSIVKFFNNSSSPNDFKVQLVQKIIIESGTAGQNNLLEIHTKNNRMTYTTRRPMDKLLSQQLLKMKLDAAVRDAEYKDKEHNKLVAELQKKIKDKDALIANKDKELADKDRIIEVKDFEIADKREKLHRLIDTTVDSHKAVKGEKTNSKKSDSSEETNKQLKTINKSLNNIIDIIKNNQSVDMSDIEKQLKNITNDIGLVSERLDDIDEHISQVENTVDNEMYNMRKSKSKPLTLGDRNEAVFIPEYINAVTIY